MDERFNDGKIPYGWYADGWTVKDNAAQKGSSSQGFDMTTMMGGGDSDFSYLMTPPLKVSNGETLVFSAKKGSGGMDSFMGSNDSTFVVERSVYGQHKWIQVADFTTEVTDEYKTFTISGTAAGEYRFRFRSASTVLIDSVAGFKIDNDAPDVLVIDTVNGAKGAIKMIDFSLCKKDSTKQVLVVNTATGKLVVNNSMSDAQKFTFSKSKIFCGSVSTNRQSGSATRSWLISSLELLSSAASKMSSPRLPTTSRLLSFLTRFPSMMTMTLSL
jgi:hypothetical protein